MIILGPDKASDATVWRTPLYAEEKKRHARTIKPVCVYAALTATGVIFAALFWASYVGAYGRLANILGAMSAVAALAWCFVPLRWLTDRGWYGSIRATGEGVRHVGEAIVTWATIEEMVARKAASLRRELRAGGRS